MAQTSRSTFYFVFILVGILGLTHILIGFRVTRLTFHQSLSRNHQITQQNVIQTTTMQMPLPDVMACSLPKLNPHDPSMMTSIWKPEEDPARCDKNSKFPLLFMTDFEHNLVALKNPLNFGHINFCCYKQISHHRNYGKFWESQECIPIKKNVTKIPAKFEFIGVLCGTKTNRPKYRSKRKRQNNFSKGAGTSTITENLRVIDAFAFVPNKAKKETNNSKPKGSPSDGDSLNVVILGLDSLSHMHFLRSMPKTHKYLTQDLSAIGMNGYFKIGDNTLPNLIPILTGLTENEMQNCGSKNSRMLKDKSRDCSYIWKIFSDHGYWTSFWQGTASVSSFESKRGLRSVQLTDYFPRPLEAFSFNNLGHIARPGENPLCLGSRLALKVVLDNIEKMAWTMAHGKIKKQYFQLNWDNSMSHDQPSNSYLGDKLILSTLKFLKTSGFLNKTVFILMSDHGFNNWHFLSGFRWTLQEKIESKMPFLYFALPDWFTKKYPAAVKNLKINVNRLTTPFDLHETLLEFLDMDKGISADQIITRDLELKRDGISGNLSRGISLFLPIPLKRTCDIAGIPVQYCACLKNIPISINKTMVNVAAKSYIKYIGLLLKPNPKCSTLTLQKIHSAEKLQFENQNITLINIVLETVPGNAIFEVIMQREKIGKWNVEWDNRASHYAEHSKNCVSENNDLKRYCYCKTNIPQNVKEKTN